MAQNETDKYDAQLSLFAWSVPQDRTKTQPTPRPRDVVRAKRAAIKAWRLSNHPGAVKLRQIYPVN